jgi:hypothetical protein
MTAGQPSIWNDRSPGPFKRIPFNLDVECPDYTEGWVDELRMFHNPNALYPVDETLFQMVSQSVV